MNRFMGFIRSWRRGEADVVGANVLDEEQLPAGSQHSLQLAQCPRLIADAAEHQCRYDDVEAVVVEGKVLGWRSEHDCVRCHFPGPSFEASQHRALRASVIVSDSTSRP